MNNRETDGKVMVAIVGGFLGAGKTTTMMSVARLLETKGRRVGIILNDQGDQLVDTEFGRVQGLGVAEVTGGCFCCKFEDLVFTTTSIVESYWLDIVLAEAVGSCTDLQATVIRPLRKYYGDRFRVAPLTVVVDAARWQELGLDAEATFHPGSRHSSIFNDLAAYLFRKQLEEADTIVLNKVDLLSEEGLETFRNSVAKTFPCGEVIPVSAETGYGLDKLMDLWLDSEANRGRSWIDERTIEVDYEKYAAAEAQLGWLNATLALRTDDEKQFRPDEWVELLLSRLSSECERWGYVVGHAKAQISTSKGVTKASLVRAGCDPAFSSRQRTAANEGELLVNVRVQAEPSVLQELMEEALASTNELLKTNSEMVYLQCFSPEPPKPTHRISETGG